MKICRQIHQGWPECRQETLPHIDIDARERVQRQTDRLDMVHAKEQFPQFIGGIFGRNAYAPGRDRQYPTLAETLPS